MVYADSVEVRSLIGNKTIKNHALVDITTTVINDAITRSDADVNLFSGVTTAWSSTDFNYPTVQEASELFASAYILIRYGINETEKELGHTYWLRAKELCMQLAQSATTAVYVSSRPYQSYPINEDGTIHRSFSSSDSTVNGE